MSTPDERAALEANEAFYRAFGAGDADAMDAVWSRGAPVTCVHPGWSELRGRRAVVDSWRAILGSARRPRVRCERAVATVLGDVVLVICRELLEDTDGERAGVLVATNAFVREDGGWRMVHHHAGRLADDDDEDDAEGGDDDEGRTSGVLN